MCGRFPQSKRPSRYSEAFDPGWKQTDFDLQPSWNVAPSRQVLVFHDNDTGHVAKLLYWGFLPSWADSKARKPINARVETAATIPYFRDAWKTGRCIVPADGWYEWKETPEGKQPYFIYRANEEPVFMAGLYASNRPANITSFAILTMEAEGTLRKIHEREPLVLSAEDARQWIRRDLPAEEIAAIVLHPLTSESFSWHTVSTKVNNTKNDGADLVSKA